MVFIEKIEFKLMNILIPVLGFGRSGGYRVLSKLADELISLDNQVYFLSPYSSEDPYYPTKATILWTNGKGCIVESNTDRNEATFFSIQKALTMGLLKLDPTSFDVVIANQSLTTLPIKLAGWSSRTLYYVQAYEPDFYAELPGLKNKIFKVLSTLSYKMGLYTVVNADLYLEYKKLKASKYLYPGVDFAYFYPEKELREDEDVITIGTIGRNEKFKGTSDVYYAFQELKKKYRNVRLKIAFGNCEDFPDMESIICVFPHGDEALGSFYRSLDYYFCAGSAQLGAFHYPVVEAMSCGVPVITTNYYPASNSNSWLVRPNCPQDMVSQFEVALNDEAMKRQKVTQALKEVQQFDWKETGRKFLQLINDQFLKGMR